MNAESTGLCVLLRVRDAPAAKFSDDPYNLRSGGNQRIAHGPRDKNCEKPFSDNSGYLFAGTKLGWIHASTQQRVRTQCACVRLPGACGAVEVTRSLAMTDHLFPAGSLCPVQIANISRTAHPPGAGDLPDRSGREEEKQRRDVTARAANERRTQRSTRRSRALA
jgi:hypothetical protein